MCLLFKRLGEIKIQSWIIKFISNWETSATYCYDHSLEFFCLFDCSSLLGLHQGSVSLEFAGSFNFILYFFPSINSWAYPRISLLLTKPILIFLLGFYFSVEGRGSRSSLCNWIWFRIIWVHDQSFWDDTNIFLIGPNFDLYMIRCERCFGDFHSWSKTLLPDSSASAKINCLPI